MNIYVIASQLSANDTYLQVLREVDIIPIKLTIMEESAFDLRSSILIQ